VCWSVRKTLSHAAENYGNTSFPPRLNSVFATKYEKKDHGRKRADVEPSHVQLLIGHTANASAAVW
jgi:hypothetical protein